MNSKSSQRGDSSARVARIPLKIGRSTPDKLRISFVAPVKNSKSPLRHRAPTADPKTDRPLNQSVAAPREKDCILQELQLLKLRESQLKQELALTSKNKSPTQLKSLGSIIQQTYHMHESPSTSTPKPPSLRKADSENRWKSSAQTRPAKKISLDVGKSIEADRSLENGPAFNARSFLHKSSLKTQTDSHATVALELKNHRAKPPAACSGQSRVLMSRKMKQSLRSHPKQLPQEDSGPAEASNRQLLLSLKRLQLNLNPKPLKQSRISSLVASLGHEASLQHASPSKTPTQTALLAHCRPTPDRSLQTDRSSRQHQPHTTSASGLEHPTTCSSARHQASASLLAQSSSQASDPHHKNAPYVSLRKELNRVRHKDCI